MQRRILITLFAAIAGTGLAWAAGPGGRPGQGPGGPGGGGGGGTVGELTQAEIDGLVFMREEEKLARDVYEALYAKWQQPVFTNIAASEQRHMDVVLALLERSDLDDPAAGLAPGEFANADLQALYDQLVADGLTSQAQAYQVGITIEETDIADLRDHIAATTQPDILRVYANLLRGSENHLDAFTRLAAGDVGPRPDGAAGRPFGRARGAGGLGGPGAGACLGGGRGAGMSGRRGGGYGPGAGGNRGGSGLGPGDGTGAGALQRRHGSGVGAGRGFGAGRGAGMGDPAVCCDVRIVGPIASIDTENSAIVVGETTVQLTADTVLWRCGTEITAGDLEVGQTVVVCGETDGDAVTAVRIMVRLNGAGGQRGMRR